MKMQKLPYDAAFLKKSRLSTIVYRLLQIQSRFRKKMEAFLEFGENNVGFFFQQ